MLTPSASPGTEQADAARRMRVAVGQLLRDLGHLPDAVREARGAMPPPQDPVSLDRLLESRERALRHAERAVVELGDGEDPAGPRSLADLHELVEEVRTGLASPRIVDDLGEMLAEAPAGPGLRALRALDTRTRRIAAEADRLFALAVAVAAGEDLFAGAKPMSDLNASAGPGDPDLTAAVRDLGEIVATVAGRSSAPVATGRGAGGRYPAVADQMAASLDAYGLPHDGVQLPPADEGERVRAQLIDGLTRNFAWRDKDGTRTYYRSAPQAAVPDADGDARLLRGAALVNANLLRAQADEVLAIMGRLPDMLRFASAEALRSAAERARLKTMLDQLVATASDPLGINAQRGAFQYQRLSAALIDILIRGEVLSPGVKAGLAGWTGSGRAEASWEPLSRAEGVMIDDLRAETSAVRDEEVVAELIGLGALMVDVKRRLSPSPANMARGVAAGRLEELLTAADGAAASLEGDLVRFGSTAAEQEVQFLRGGERNDVSVAQFIGWVHALCEPFTGAENAAAALSKDELFILGEELGAVLSCANDFAVPSGVMPTGFGGVRRQFEELKRFIEEAKAQADLLAGKASSIGVASRAPNQE